MQFVNLYNNDHHHSGLNFLTPVQRRSGESNTILAKRHAVYEAFKAEHTERWRGRTTRNWTLPEGVYLNPDRDRKEEGLISGSIISETLTCSA